MTEIFKLVGSKIRDFRKLRNLSQDKLGELCGFHFSYIGGVERGERNITLENIGKIAKALDIEPKLLFDFDDSFFSSIAEERQAAIEEVILFLKDKDIRHIHMTRNILHEIFASFPRN